MMQLTAKHADVWESYLSPEQFASINSEFEKISNQTTKTFVKSIELDVIIANSDSEQEYKKRLFAMERGPALLSQLLKNSLVGKPEDIAQKVRNYIMNIRTSLPKLISYSSPKLLFFFRYVGMIKTYPICSYT